MSKCFFHIRNSRVSNPKVIRILFDPQGTGDVSLKDGKYIMEITSAGKRSLAQNNYFHGCVIPIVFKGLRDAGFDDVRNTDDAKMVIKSLFLKRRIKNSDTGELITDIIKDTSDLSTTEMINFIDEVVRWAAAYLGVTIPAPGTQSEIEYHDKIFNDSV